MKKYGDELKKDSGKWIDSSVWHGKAHTWAKMPWLIKEVRFIPLATPLPSPLIQHTANLVLTAGVVEAHLERPTLRHQRHPMRRRRAQSARVRLRGHRRFEPCWETGGWGCRQFGGIA